MAARRSKPEKIKGSSGGSSDPLHGSQKSVPGRSLSASKGKPAPALTLDEQVTALLRAVAASTAYLWREMLDCAPQDLLLDEAGRRVQEDGRDGAAWAALSPWVEIPEDELRERCENSDVALLTDSATRDALESSDLLTLAHAAVYDRWQPSADGLINLQRYLQDEFNLYS